MCVTRRRSTSRSPTTTSPSQLRLTNAWMIPCCAQVEGLCSEQCSAPTEWVRAACQVAYIDCRVCSCDCGVFTAKFADYLSEDRDLEFGQRYNTRCRFSL